MLSVLTIEECDKWDRIVTSFKRHDVYYLSSYVKAFQIHGDGEPNLVYFDNGKTRAINVVMKRDIARTENFKDQLPRNTWFDLSTPYGYGGLLVEGDDFAELNEVYTKYCIENNIVSEFVRFHPMLENAASAKEIYDVRELGKTVYIDLRGQDYIWDNFTGKNRNVIRKAKKHGVEIYWGRSRELFQQFIEMYNATMDGQKADAYYYFGTAFYESILYDLRNNSMIFYSVLDGRIIAMSIIMFCNKQMHYHLSASDWEYRNCAATNLLLYEAALWGIANGYRTFHLGGGLGSAEDSLYKFKKAFNRTSSTAFAIGRKCFDFDIYNNLVELRKSRGDFSKETLFFPLYRC